MAIRAAVRSDLQPLDGLESLMKNINKAAEKIMGEVADKRGPKLLRPMHNLKPGRSRHGAKRGAWSTNTAADARARRWWFKAIADGRVKTDGRRYIRTGKTNKGWTLTARTTNRRTSLALENNSRGARYTFSFAKGVRPRGGRPNPGHIRTGWPQKVRKVGLKVLDDARDAVEDAFAETVAASISKGRFTIVVP